MLCESLSAIKHHNQVEKRTFLVGTISIALTIRSFDSLLQGNVRQLLAE